jgi:predicted MPP superfamily phosphohydrolase
VSLALLSDLHNADPAPVIASLRDHAPSLICITGDVLYGGRPEGDTSPLETQTNVHPFLRSCVAIAPTFLSLGNHEWMVDQEDLRLLSSTGVTVLDNEWTYISIDGQEIAIAGLTSGYVTDYRSFRAESGSPDRYPHQESISGIGGAVHARDHKPETDWLPSFTSQPGYKIILSHHPEYWPLLKDENIDLILSGHAHGGQWRFFNRGVFAPGQGWWPRYTKGVYEGKLVVSAGLSNTTWVPRLFNPTEVVYIEGS